jgi:hypothetical protein
MARKLLGLFLIFFVFYMSAHYYIRWRNTVTDDVTKIGRLVECQPNDVRAITIHQLTGGREEDLAFERLDHPEPGIPAVAAVDRWQWKMKTPVAGEADPAVIRRIASTLCELYDPIPVRASDFKPETLTRRLGRQLDATLATPSGEAKVSVDFGALTDRTTVIRYRGFGKESTVRIPDLFLETVSLPVDDYRNKKVMRTDADNVQQATLVIDGKERFTLERAGADWKVLLGGKEKGEGSDEAAKFVNRVSTVRAIGIDSEGISPQDCSALKARAVVDVRDVLGKVEEVRFAYGPRTDVTACSSLGSQKFHVHHDLVPFLDVPLKMVLKK